MLQGALAAGYNAAIFCVASPTLPRKLIEITGAPGRTRTRDPLITNQVLYQLSYKGMKERIAQSASK
jgi:hypothetical protein